MSEFAVAGLGEIEEQSDGRCPWRPVAAHFGITSFGANTWTASEAGERLINEHDESESGSDEELYVVLSGRATFELDGEQVDAPAGAMVFARPGVRRTAIAEEAGTTVLALGGVPGKAYEPSGWVYWGSVNPLYAAGSYAEAADRGRELVDAHPGYPDMLYNLACCESLAGRSNDALNHLRQAVQLSDRTRELARGDSDFDAIRTEPEFAELIG